MYRGSKKKDKKKRGDKGSVALNWRAVGRNRVAGELCKHLIDA